MDASGVEKTSASTPLNYSTCCSTTSQLQLRLRLPSRLAGARCTVHGGRVRSVLSTLFLQQMHTPRCTIVPVR